MCFSSVRLASYTQGTGRKLVYTRTGGMLGRGATRSYTVFLESNSSQISSTSVFIFVFQSLDLLKLSNKVNKSEKNDELIIILHSVVNSVFSFD